MFSIFSIPKPFLGQTKIIQRNAIRSWVALGCECEVVLFGDDDGVADTAEEFGIRHVASIEKNEFGTPLLSSVFSSAQHLATNNILMYVNADIVLCQDLIEAIRRVNVPLFLMSGRRWDLDVKDEINFQDSEWSKKLGERIAKDGKRHGFSGMDYFVFPRNFVNMPAFAVGRPGWDAWFIYDARSHRIPVIDATAAITAIHQNHDYSHSKYGEKQRVGGPEWDRNIELAGGFSNLLTLRDADWVLGEKGLERPTFPRRLMSAMSLCAIWRILISFKRKKIDQLMNSLKRPLKSKS